MPISDDLFTGERPRRPEGMEEEDREEEGDSAALMPHLMRMAPHRLQPGRG